MKKLALAALIALVGTPALAAAPILITGAGATFPNRDWIPRSHPTAS